MAARAYGAASADRAAHVPALAEAFREHGFAGPSVTALCAATGLGTGSLYNFFPGGKEEMAAAVLADVDAWFAASVFGPLRAAGHGEPAAWLAAVETVAAIQGAIVLSRALDSPKIFLQVTSRPGPASARPRPPEHARRGRYPHDATVTG